MTFDIDIVLRDTEHAMTEQMTYATEPSAWTEADVRAILTEILAAIARVKDPDAARPSVALRGFSWIVEPWNPGERGPRSEHARVVIAIEIPTGAAVAGPFDVPHDRLTHLIARVVASPATIH